MLRCRAVEVAEISFALRNGLAVTDAQFDRLFPSSQRRRSQFHWTPIDVALRTCALLAPVQGQRILDVGCGAGKLCIVGALTTTASWLGVEVDLRMVRAAEAAARRLHLDGRLELVHGDAHAIDWATFDAIYLFNPFVEGLFDSAVDAGVRHDQYLQSVERTKQQLVTMRPGARLVTYHGFGGEVPEDFELLHRESVGGDQLCMWVRGAGPK